MWFSAALGNSLNPLDLFVLLRGREAQAYLQKLKQAIHNKSLFFKVEALQSATMYHNFIFFGIGRVKLQNDKIGGVELFFKTVVC